MAAVTSGLMVAVDSEPPTATPPPLTPRAARVAFRRFPGLELEIVGDV